MFSIAFRDHIFTIIKIVTGLLLLPLFSQGQKSCTGLANCSVCKNCKYCKYCNSGGTCGVCRPGQKATTTHKAHKYKTVKNYVVFNKEEPAEDNINSYDVVVSDLEKQAFTSEMWPLINKIVELNKIDTNTNRTVRIYLYVRANDGYYCYFQKSPSTESTIEY